MKEKMLKIPVTEFIFFLCLSFFQKYPPVKFLSEKDRKRILVCIFIIAIIAYNHHFNRLFIFF